MRRVLDPDVLALFEPLRGSVGTVLAFDPSTTSTGWSLWLSGDLYHGQGDPEDGIRAVDKLRAPSTSPIDVLAIEAPYKVGGMRVKKKNGKAVLNAEGEPEMTGSGQQWKVAEIAGLLRGAYFRQARVMWRPVPTSWRAVLGLNKGPLGTTKRDDVNDGVWLWAKETARAPLQHLTHEGKIKKHFDEANAIGLLHAALSLALARPAARLL